ncbi:ethanolamine ammonia-lyase reactivating factor EutA [Cohnella sp. WQ 127256]|uniref:ethanolamine ammonia-lyase reactivating factor EutA n=1 Tax=Cohnella sp. WQ 127256 TaxID=2938790 RepID=UPI0021186C6E|nr:ethanolamine ammonia-lyase reactivating factor EutA [Cohnella sp. WQ 127256]
MDGSWITSAGIDIGTSTTKIIISRLKLVRASSALSLPRYEIAERQLLYASPIYQTPLKSWDEIDADRVWSIVSGELAKAGITKADLKSGAVIITGETATKANASSIVHLLSERSGDFVVATAGADLEGYLAGKGAGADRRSNQIRGAVANIDVGGGTANVAIFRRGKAIGTVTFHIGGRLIQLGERGNLLYISPSIRPWLNYRGYKLERGSSITFIDLKELCQQLCRSLLRYLSGNASSEQTYEAHTLLLGKPLNPLPDMEEWMVSGGIGKLMQDQAPVTLAETAIFQDIGPLLAHTLKECMNEYSLRWIEAEETVRATVIGAGMQSTEISGATVHLNAKLLPIRNLPVLKLDINEAMFHPPIELGHAVEETLRGSTSLFDSEASPPFALSVTGTFALNYVNLQQLAEQLHIRFIRYFPNSEVMVVICERDIAQALGQALQRRAGSGLQVICIDQIRVEHGDYIDLGEPISGMMIPVVVKTLAFSQRDGGMDS